MSQLFDIEDIRAMLPHRYPMLLLDRIIELVPGKRILAQKNVTVNEPFFNGHFPDLAIMPGVLIVETMAQAAGLMILSLPGYEGKMAYIATIEKAHFRHPVVPGDMLMIESEIIKVRGLIGKARVQIKVDGNAVADCELTFAFRTRPDKVDMRLKLNAVRRDHGIAEDVE